MSSAAFRRCTARTMFLRPMAPTSAVPIRRRRTNRRLRSAIARGAIDPASPIPPTPPSQPEYAITHHKDIQHPGDPVVTSTFVDGLERVIQTKKDLDRDVAGSTQTGMTASARSASTVLDALSRKINRRSIRVAIQPSITDRQPGPDTSRALSTRSAGSQEKGDDA